MSHRDVKLAEMQERLLQSLKDRLSIQEAKALLTGTEKSIEQVAEETGFCSESYQSSSIVIGEK